MNDDAHIDSHFHIWQLARGDYGWLTPELGVIHRDVQITDWLAEATPHGVVGGVLVQAAPTEAETEFLLMQAEAHEAVLGVVGWVDWLATDAPARIAQLATHPKLKGLRPMLQDIADPAWVLQTALEPALRAMVAHGLMFDALITPQHLPHIETLAKRHPDLRLVIDHAAKPDIASNQWQPWADGLARIAATTGAFCKISGLLTEAGDDPSPAVMRPWAQHVLQVFGPQRVVWGSDWPVLQRAGTYAAWHAESAQIFSSLSAADQAAVWGGNARSLYRL